MKIDSKTLPIQYSCYFSRSRVGEQFVPEHTLCYVLSGISVMNDGKTSKTFREGDLYFCRRNQLVKYTKFPPDGGEYKSISIYFDQEMLRNFSLEQAYQVTAKHDIPTFFSLSSRSVLSSYMESLREYEQIFRQDGSETLIKIKQQEAILLLLQLQPELKQVLFDFSDPGKIDLEAFMNQNFYFNVALQRFAYLTGRSLSTFKRDFERIFHMTPSRWLLQRRLQEAYYLIKEKGQAASAIYLDLGFEDLSHFSFVFKKHYGKPPSAL